MDTLNIETVEAGDENLGINFILPKMTIMVTEISNLNFVVFLSLFKAI